MEPQRATSKANSLVFNVHRREPELVRPAKSTPRELMSLSGIDDQDLLRCHARIIFFFRHNPLPVTRIKGNGGNDNNSSSDAVEVIRKALAETLVYYYPFAGRLREGPDRSLLVDCNGSGVLFVEADADVTLDEFGDLHPPFPCSELLLGVEVPAGCLHSPLLILQVTRLKCGAFVLAVSFNHVICDGVGLRLFLRTLEELARGSKAPSLQPVSDRRLLTVGVPSRVTHVHREYEEDAQEASDTIIPQDHRVERSIFFGSADISAIRRLVPSDLRGSSFELLASLLWRCRTLALMPLPDAKTRLMIAVNARPCFRNPSLPPGYYGNVVPIPVAIATARELSEQPLGFAVRLVQDAKSSVTEEHVRSLAGRLGARGGEYLTMPETFLVSDLRRLGLDQVDLGWGPPVYSGVPGAGLGAFDGASSLGPCKNKNGEIGVVVSIILPEPAMERFAEQLALALDSAGSSNPMRSSL